jgi:hypothetical protein
MIDVAHKSVWCLCLNLVALTSVKRMWVMCCAVSSALVCALSSWVCDTPRRIWPMWVVACDCSQVTSPKYTCIWAVRDALRYEAIDNARWGPCRMRGSKFLRQDGLPCSRGSAYIVFWLLWFGGWLVYSAWWGWDGWICGAAIVEETTNNLL